MKAFLLVIVFLSFYAQGCNRVEPSYPKEATGWKDFERHGIKVRGSFVLHKGESTNNGQVQVKVRDILPPEHVLDHGDIRAQARVTLEFTRVSDQKLLCTKIGPEHGGVSLDRCEGLSDDFQIFDVGVGDINIKDGWVFFYIYGNY